MKSTKKYVAGCCKLIEDDDPRRIQQPYKTAEYHKSYEADSRWKARRWMREQIKWADKHNFKIELTYYETESIRYDINIDENGKILIT